MQHIRETRRVATGISGLDEILYGGLPAGQMYLLEGDPGTGKTTVAMQFVLEGKRLGQRCLYVTLSESREELQSAAASHGWSLDGIAIVEFVPEEAILNPENAYTVFHPSEVELTGTIQKLLGEIERINPERLILDSLSEFRLLSADAVHYRRQLLALKHYFGSRHTTALVLDDRTGEGHDLQLQSIAHGVIRLEKQPRSYGVTRRRVEILKVRGAAFSEGYHDYSIGQSGLIVFPRLIAAEHKAEIPQSRVLSGVDALDAMFAGGIARGTSTLVLGPTGVGKSSITMHYALSAALRNERAVMYLFDEAARMAQVRAASLHLEIQGAVDAGTMSMIQVDSAELSPGEFVSRVRHEVEQGDAKVVVIDSLNGFIHSMPGESDLALQLHELLTFLGKRGVATFLVLTEHGVFGDTRSVVDVSYLADAVIVIRYFEADASVRRAISVLKNRSGPHEQTIRELTLSSNGIQIGKPLVNFKGILTGIPDYTEQDLSTQDAMLGS